MIDFKTITVVSDGTVAGTTVTLGDEKLKCHGVLWALTRDGRGRLTVELDQPKEHAEWWSLDDAVFERNPVFDADLSGEAHE